MTVRSHDAPEFTVSPLVTRLSYNSFAVVGTIDRPGNIYAYVVADGAGVPTSSQVKALGQSAVGAYFNIELASLTESTAYDCYVVAEDSNGLLQSSPTKIDVSTTANLNTLLGSTLKLWINGRSRSNKTLTGDFSTRFVSGTSDESTSPSTYNNSGGTVQGGSVQLRARHNGKALYFKSGSGIEIADTSKFNFVHNGSAFTIAARVCIITASDTTVTPIMMNSNGTTAKTGFNLSYDNRSSAGRTNALIFNVTKSSAGVTVFSVIIDSFFTQGVFVTITIKYDGVNTLTVYKDGVSQGTYAPSTTFAATNASDNLGIGKYSTTATYATNTMIKDIVMCDTALSDGNRGSVESYLLTGGETLGEGGAANAYMMHGQSNMAGYPTSPGALLSAVLDTYIWNQTDDNATTIHSGQFFRQLQFNVSQNTEDIARFGPELMFGYLMAQRMPKTAFLLKWGVSSSGLVLNGSAVDWNVASGSTECAQQATNQLTNGLTDLKYELDRAVTVRGWLWRQGEADAGVGNVNYKTDLYALLNKFIDAIYANGFTSNKARGVISLIDNNFTGTPRPYRDDIVTAMQDFCDDYFTDNASYASKWAANSAFSTNDLTLADGTHFDSAGMVAQGQRFYDVLGPYVTE